MFKKRIHLTLAGLALTALPLASFAFVSVGVSINIAPPALPVYVQPPCPTVGYIWTPGYWAWGDDDYYWVPGTWIAAPSPGLLWTPGYWGWSEGAYLWHGGYWGPHVGFYGGVNYGFGYGGVGFEGGEWRGNSFYYNRSATNLGGLNVTNVYNRTVINNVTVNRVSFNGGTGGLQARPNSEELRAEHDRHVEATSGQREQEHMASSNRDLRASVNGGKPRIAATPRPGSFTGHGVEGASAAGGPVHAANHGESAHQAGTVEHNDRPGAGAAAARNSNGGNPGHGDTAHVGENRNDRPPGAGGAGMHNVNGGNPSHGETAHVGESHNDRPPGGGGGAVHNVNGGNPGRGVAQERLPQDHAAQERAPQRPQQQHANQVNEPREGHSGGGAPHPQAAPHAQAAPRPQAAPHPQNAPRENAPRAEPRREGEPHGQPQARAQREDNHGHH